MVLDPKRARAGPASCSFSKKTHKGSTWTVAGRCSDGTSSWAATVRLVVNGKRLTWSSERGTQVYRRCG
jgi:uncharacterized membrane protein